MYLITYSSSSEEYSPYSWFILQVNDYFLKLLTEAENLLSSASVSLQTAEFVYANAWFTDQKLDEDLDLELTKGIWLSKGVEWESNPNGEAEQADCFRIDRESFQFVLNPIHTDNLRVYSENIQPTELREWLNKALRF